MSTKTSIAICAYGEIGYKLLHFAIMQPQKIAKVFIRADDDYAKDKISICEKNHIDYGVVKSIEDDACIEFFSRESLDIVFLLWWPDIVPKNIIKLSRRGFVNLHPSFLPYNRGMHPYYWSIVDKTPAGVSLHFINEKIDSGEIIDQERIQTDITFTGEKLYHAAAKKIISLFKKNYEKILTNKITCKPVDISRGTFHLKKDLDVHSEIILERKYKAEELLDIIRGRTFTSMPSSYFYKDGKKYHVRVQIEEAE